jgi:hypothetical protein
VDYLLIRCLPELLNIYAGKKEQATAPFPAVEDKNMTELFLPAPREESVNLSKKRRDMECLRLKARGYTLEQIAIKMGMDSEKKVGQSIVRATAATRIWAVDEQRIIEYESLAELEARLWELLREGESKVNARGELILDQFGREVPDKRFYIEVTDRILKAKERRARMLGLDAPSRHQVMTLDSVESAIRDLEAELNYKVVQGQLESKPAESPG